MIKSDMKRWYFEVGNDNIRDFIKEYDFGFVPEIGVNISADSQSPINKEFEEKYKELKITNTYKSKVDIRQMPYEDNSIDILITEWVLEHVAHVWEAPPEIYRVLRVGGITIHHVPFMYPEHGVHDLFRFTRLGLEDLFSEFEVLQLDCSGHQEITNFLMKYRSNHSERKKFVDEKIASKKIIDKVGYGFVGNLCSCSVWGCFRKGEKK